MKECSLCRYDENEKELTNFDCDICKTGSWFICNDCDKKLKNKFDKCPMCRSNLKKIDVKIELNSSTDESESDSDSDSDSDSETQNNITLYSRIYINYNTILEYSFMFFMFLMSMLALFLLIGMYMLLCDRKCVVCHILSVFCGILNYIFLFILCCGCDIQTTRLIIGLLVFMNGNYIFILGGIVYHCDDEFTQHSEDEYCGCIFVSNLIYIPLVTCLLSCCICSKNDDN